MIAVTGPISPNAKFRFIPEIENSHCGLTRAKALYLHAARAIHEASAEAL